MLNVGLFLELVGPGTRAQTEARTPHVAKK